MGHNLPYWLMHGNWHGLAKMAAKRYCHKQQCKAARCHPLSLVDNIKIYFINNTCYFNARCNYVNKIYRIRLVCYFGACCRSFGVIVLSVMTQQRAIIDNALYHHFSPSTRRLGALESLCHSPTFVPLLHPLFLHARPLPPFGWLLHPIIPSAAG